MNLPFGTKALPGRSAEDILKLAAEFDTMAATAATQDGKQALEKLATRFRIFAALRAAGRRTNGQGVRPGTPAPATGWYELHNVFGTWVGDFVRVRQGQLLPRAPHEFTWNLTTAKT